MPRDVHHGRLSTAFHNYGNVTAAEASRLAALLVGQILPVFSLLGSLPSGRLAGLAGIDLPVTGHKEPIDTDIILRPATSVSWAARGD